MRRFFLPSLLLFFAFWMRCAAVGADAGSWKRIASLPDPLGVAGPFAGGSDGALIVAGGANFPQGMPWEGGKKAWTDKAWVLTAKGSAFREPGRLPRPLAYGVSVPGDDGVLCIGGCDADRHYADVFELRWQDGRLTSQALPPLPIPLAYACGARVGDTVCVAGGTLEPGEKRASNRAFALDLKNPRLAWRELPPLPGRARLLATAAATDGAFFVLGGVALESVTTERSERVYLRDAWRYRERSGWEQLPDLPRPNAAAPSPAPVAEGKIFLIAGDDGSRRNFEPIAQHPGFVPAIFTFDLRAGTWTPAGETPAPRATVPCVEWAGAFVIPSGEARPGVRSPEVWRFQPKR